MNILRKGLFLGALAASSFFLPDAQAFTPQNGEQIVNVGRWDGHRGGSWNRHGGNRNWGHRNWSGSRFYGSYGYPRSSYYYNYPYGNTYYYPYGYRYYNRPYGGLQFRIGL